MILLLFINISSVEALDKTEAETAIDGAERGLISAYEGVLEAEKEGANVTSLTQKLTAAGANLTTVYLHFKEQNYSEAVTLAENCTEIAEDVKTQASSLRDYAAWNVRQTLWFQILGWLISIGIIFSATFFVWRVFKKRYYRKILEMQPEATYDEH